jgi:hypothetical protein
LATNKKREKKAKPRLKRLPPSSAAARDEGPRLVPLPETGAETSRLEHYLELADSALGGAAETSEDDDEQD